MTIKSAETFFEAIENPPPPHAKLKAAMAAYTKSFSHDED